MGMKDQVINEPRPINVIAREISREWKNVYFGAVPYLAAMRTLSSPKDMFGVESAERVVRYFLSNASTYQGDTARAHKKELKAHFGIK